MARTTLAHAAGRILAFERTFFQTYALYPDLTVAENIAFGLKLHKVPKAEIRRRVAAAGG